MKLKMHFSSLQAAAENGNAVVVAIPGIKGHFHGLVGQYKADGVTETLHLRKFDSATAVQDFIATNLHFFTSDTGSSSLIAFLCSVMLSRGLARTKGKSPCLKQFSHLIERTFSC